jgi:hypothetical protein
MKDQSSRRMALRAPPVFDEPSPPVLFSFASPWVSRTALEARTVVVGKTFEG